MLERKCCCSTMIRHPLRSLWSWCGRSMTCVTQPAPLSTTSTWSSYWHCVPRARTSTLRSSVTPCSPLMTLSAWSLIRTVSQRYLQFCLIQGWRTSPLFLFFGIIIPYKGYLSIYFTSQTGSCWSMMDLKIDELKERKLNI